MRARAYSSSLGGGFHALAWMLATIVFLTWSLQFFAATAPLVALLRLTPAVWREGFLWQLLTYPAAGVGAPTPWILLELFVLVLFANAAVERMGRRGLWRLLGWSALAGAVVTIGVDALASTWGGGALAYPLIQGQRALLAALIAAFATLNPRATIMLFFVIPMPARWFLPLEVLLAFIGFLATKDLPGFLGLLVLIGVAWLVARGGSPWRNLREARLRLEAWWLRRRLDRRRRRSGLVVLPGGRDQRPN